MTHTSAMYSSRPILTCAVGVVLAGCGGGGGSSDELDRALSSDTAQGYAADAQAMPLSAGTTVQLATLALEAALSGGGHLPVPGPTSQVSFAAPCNNGGSINIGITGGTAQQRDNGVLDAGETYTITFAQCGHLDNRGVLDGSLTLVVNAFSGSQADLTHSANALQLTSTQGRYTLQGAVRERRSSTASSGGGQRISSQLTSAGISLQSLVSGRTSSYELRALDWTVVSLLDSSGALLRRTHQGTLSLTASTPRRPQATLQVVTQGTLVAADNGLYAAQGSFGLATHNDSIAVTYGTTTVTLELDLGNNGSIDRRWTLPRVGFDAEAG
ncbi:MAG TPA: hypothetical protein VEZ89_02980 [Rubrivivax sp.]|nr:hypothetical protein [Rubrivivax sp.]